MCGIVGARHDWLLRNGLDPATAMRDAVAALAWRGPDGQHVVRIGDWWLGCARLAITQPRSVQPVVRRGGRYAGVLNGAITNARELWEKLLPGAGRRAAPPNDAWLPLLAVARGERHLLEQLRGHHAYAVVDASTGELILGQDRYGEKPLLQLVDRAVELRSPVAFGSTVPALQALGAPPLGAPPPAVRARTGEWFESGFAAELPYPPAEHVRLTEVPRDVTVRVGTAPAAPAALRSALCAAVARCADASVPIGLLLSGGVDSSCLAAGLREAGRRAPAYQFHAEGTSLAERAVARAVAAHCGLALREVDAGPEVLAALPELTRCAGLPLGDPSVLAVHAVARAAAAEGVRILLGGEGADELFLGYRRYRALAHLPRLPLPRGLLPQWSMRYFARWLRATAAADPARALLAVVPPAFAREVLDERHRAADSRHGDPANRAARTPRLVEQARLADLGGYLRFDLLPKVDVATMAAGIESRCPFLEANLAAPAVRAELGKQSLRAAFANDLPAAVFRQPKRGFALPLDRWFRGELPWLDLLAEPKTAQRDHLRPGGVAAVVDRHRRGRADLGHGLYLLVAFELFLRAAEGGRFCTQERTDARPGA